MLRLRSLIDRSRFLSELFAMFHLIASASPAVSLLPIAVICLAIGCAIGYSLLPTGRRVGLVSLLVLGLIAIFVVRNSLSRYETNLNMIRSLERTQAIHALENTPEQSDAHEARDGVRFANGRSPSRAR